MSPNEWNEFLKHMPIFVCMNCSVTAANMSLVNMFCSRCEEGFEPHEKIVNSNGELWHTQCFV